MLDCRWLGIGGPGRTTEVVLRGLAPAPPAGRWILWGPAAATAALAWPGADVRPVAGDPRRLLGQGHALAIPRAGFHVFMHQARPLRPVPATTLIYDTIPLRYGGSRATRALKRAFLQAVAAMSRHILTISEHSKATIVADLGVDPDRVEILRFPFDEAMADRVRRRRAAAPRRRVALFVGGFLPHKNLPRLLKAFGQTELCRSGGRLVLVAGTAAQAATMTDTLDAGQRAFVDVRHSLSQAELDDLYATSLLLVQPSLEEGFGLPAWEAMCCGLTVCVSDGGALPEVVRGVAEPFPATSVPAMAAAIDAAAAAADGLDEAARARLVALVQGRAPTIAEFGARFETLVTASAAAARP